MSIAYTRMSILGSRGLGARRGASYNHMNSGVVALIQRQVKPMSLVRALGRDESGFDGFRQDGLVPY